MDRVRTVRERKNLSDRNETIVRWLGKVIHGLWSLALPFTLTIVLGLCAGKSSQAGMPGVEIIFLDEAVKDSNTGGNISNVVIGTQFMNVSSRLSASRNSEQGRSMRGISGELKSRDLYAGLLSDAGFGYKSSDDETSFFSNIGAFVQGADFFGNKELTGDPAFGFDNKDIGLGVDYKLGDKVVIGTIFNYTNGDTDFDLNHESTDASTKKLSLYGTYNVTNEIYIDGYGMYGWNDFDSKRKFNLSSETSTQANQLSRIDNAGTLYTVGVSSGYDFVLGATTVGPLGRLFYAKTAVDGFSKTIKTSDTESETLIIGDQTSDSLTTNLGMEASYAYKTSERLQKIRLGVLIPQVRAEWVHEYMNGSKNLEATLVQANQIMSSATAEPDRDFLKVGCGLSGIFANGISAYFQYEEVIGLSHITAHNVAFGVRVEL